MEAGDGSVVRLGQMELRFLVDKSNGSPDLVMFEIVIPPGARVPVPHYHREVDEAVYGLEGVLTTIVDGRKQELDVGDTIFIPRGSVHHHENLHQGVSRSLVVLTPGSIGRRYFEEMAQIINVPGKPDLAKAKDVMSRHGLIPA